MKKALIISLIVNAVLLAGVILLYLSQKPQPTVAVAPIPAQSAAQALSGHLAFSNSTTLSSHTQSGAFRWSQLDASDYHTYVKNLRTVGCPKVTLRAIVTADVEAAFHFRIHEIQKQLAQLKNGSWTNLAAAINVKKSLDAELQSMPEKEKAAIDDYLGLKKDPPQSVAGTEASTPDSRETPSAILPVVFQDVDVSEMNLSEAQRKAITSIRQDFLAQIGDTNQNPNDPLYLERWQKAQPQADAQAQAMLGIEAYLDYQTKASQKMIEKQAMDLPVNP